MVCKQQQRVERIFLAACRHRWWRTRHFSGCNKPRLMLIITLPNLLLEFNSAENASYFPGKQLCSGCTQDVWSCRQLFIQHQHWARCDLKIDIFKSSWSLMKKILACLSVWTPVESYIFVLSSPNVNMAQKRHNLMVWNKRIKVTVWAQSLTCPMVW